MGTLAVAVSIATVYHPVAVLIAVGALAVIAVCALRAEIALLLLVATAPLEGVVNIAPGGLSMTKLAGLLCFTSFFLNAFATRRRLWLDRTHAIVLLLLLTALVSSALARNIPEALSVTLRYGSFVALYIVITQFVGDHVLQRRIAWTLTISSAITGALAIRYFIGGEQQLAVVPYADPNDTAFILATTLPLSFWLFRQSRALWPLVVVSIGVISAAVVLSFSRGALVGLAAAMIWQVVANRRSLPIVIGGVLLLVVSVAIFVYANPEQVRAGLLAKQNVAAYNVELRQEAWGAATQLALEHPVGVGPGNFTFYFLEASGRPQGSENLGVVHNTYLDLAAEMGISSMILFLAYLGISFSRLNQAVRENLGAPGFAVAVRASLVVAAVSGLALSEQYYAPFWVIGGLATVMWAEKRAAEAMAEADDDLTTPKDNRLLAETA